MNEKKLFSRLSLMAAFGFLLLMECIASSCAQKEDWHWKLVSPNHGPSARRSHATAIDPALGIMVLFGGYGNGSHLGDTWIFNITSSSWVRVNVTLAPSPRAAANLVFSPVTNEMYLFGGFAHGHNVALNDTWAFDPVTQKWTEEKPSSSPSERASYGMAYDSKRHRFMLFGGFTENGYYNDLWSYDISSNAWTKIIPKYLQSINASSAIPEARGAMGFVYDEKSDIYVMYGGFSDSGILSDTWAFDPRSDGWQEMNPKIHPPPLRTRMAYDNIGAVTILFGGDTTGPESAEAEVVPYHGLWAYDYGSNEWVKLATTGAYTPSARSLNSISFDSKEYMLIVFGGTDTLIDDANFNGREFDDLWVLSNSGSGVINDPQDQLQTIILAVVVGITGTALGIFSYTRRAKAGLK